MTGAGALVTRRLSLHPLTPADAGLMLAIWNDPAFVRFVGDRGVRTEDVACHNRAQSLIIRLPPLAAVWFAFDSVEPGSD